MKKIDRAAYVAERLDEIYPETPVPLNHKSKFELLIAVLLSAQCTDERVNQVTPQLFSLADNPLDCLLYTSPSPRDATLSRMPSSA